MFQVLFFMVLLFVECKSERFFIICHHISLTNLSEDLFDFKVNLTFQENNEYVTSAYFKVGKLNKNTDYLVPAYSQDENILILLFDLPKKSYNLSINISDREGKQQFHQEPISFEMGNFQNMGIEASYVNLICFQCHKQCANCIISDDWQKRCPSRCEIYPEGCKATYNLYVKLRNVKGGFSIFSGNNILFKITNQEALQNGVVFPLYSESNIIIKFVAHEIVIILKNRSTWWRNMKNFEIEFKKVEDENLETPPYRYVVHYFTYPSESDESMDISLIICARKNEKSHSCDLGTFQSRLSSRKYSTSFLPFVFGNSTINQSVVLDIHIREYIAGDLNENTDSMTLYLPSEIFSRSLPFESCIKRHCLKILPDPFILPDDKHEIKLKYLQHLVFAEPQIRFCHIFDDPFGSSMITPDADGTLTIKMAKRYSNILLLMSYKDYRYPITLTVENNTSTFHDLELNDGEFELNQEFIVLSVSKGNIERSLIKTREDGDNDDQCSTFEKTSRYYDIAIYLMSFVACIIIITDIFLYYYLYKPCRDELQEERSLREYD